MALHILDTTALSNFALIERPELIHVALKGEVATTTAVRAELSAGESLGFIPVCDWSWLPVIDLTSAEYGLYERLRLVLDDGEASCLAVVMMRQAVLLTDDFQARRLAKQEQIQISRTIGLLLMLVRSEHITLREANIMLSEMIQHGYRSPVSNLNAFLD